MTDEHLWLIIGQALFSARFLLQWLTSERAGVCANRVLVFHIGGSIALLGLSHPQGGSGIHCGQARGLMIYFRNLYSSNR